MLSFCVCYAFALKQTLTFDKQASKQHRLIVHYYARCLDGIKPCLGIFLSLFFPFVFVWNILWLNITSVLLHDPNDEHPDDYAYDLQTPLSIRILNVFGIEKERLFHCNMLAIVRF